MSVPFPPPLGSQPDPHLWLELDTPGLVLVRTGKVEYGQGVLTALTQFCADAFAVDASQVRMRPARTRGGPDEGFTVGSMSIEESGPVMTALGTALRGRLLRLAAAAAGCAAADLQVRQGEVFRGGTGTGWTYWSCARDLLGEPFTAADLQGVPAGTRAVVGTSLPRVDLPAKFRGGAFIHDLRLEGMVHAVAVRQPQRGARLLQVDTTRFRARHPAARWVRRGDFLAVVDGTAAAARAAQATLAACCRWSTVPVEGDIPADLPAWLDAQPARHTRLLAEAPVPAGAEPVEFTWTRPFIAHASIGLSCALAWVQGDLLEVWSHSQGIFALRDAIARVLGWDRERVCVRHVAGAGCYGHNGADDVALDAALVAVELPGLPVRVQWSRDEELGQSPLGAASRVHLQAALDAGGRISLWNTRVRSTSHLMRPGVGGTPNLLAAEAVDPAWRAPLDFDLPFERDGGAARSAQPVYAVGPQGLSVDLVTSHVRTSALRSLGTHINTVAIEGMMDELAQRAGRDPIEFRLQHLDQPRGAAVLREVVQRSGGLDAPAGRTRGAALGRYKSNGAWCAVVAEIALDEAVQVLHLWCAVDGGQIVNPDGARNQVEGGALQAISWTLLEQVRFVDGRPAPDGWDGYPILRFDQIPAIDTVFVAAPGNPPLGLGEASQGPAAAAVVNAVSRAIGERLTDLPLDRERLLRLLAAA